MADSCMLAPESSATSVSSSSAAASVVSAAASSVADSASSAGASVAAGAASSAGAQGDGVAQREAPNAHGDHDDAQDRQQARLSLFLLLFTRSPPLRQ